MDHMKANLERVEHELTLFFNSNSKLYVGYLFTSLMVGMGVWAWSRYKEGKSLDLRGFVRYALDPKMYNHASSWQDYGLFVFNALFYFGLIAQFQVSTEWFAGGTDALLEMIFGVLEQPLVVSFAGILMLSAVVGMLYDFSTFIGHYAFHKYPPLWAFHKVHHSASVMTPVSVNRLHPVELYINSLAFALCVGVGEGLFAYLTMQEVTGAKVRGISLMLFLFFVTGVNLRHSHIWVSYPRWLSWFLLSPAQHQIHHSADTKHYTKNLGFIFSFWDRLFGTLYVPKEREEIQFGLTLNNPNPYTSLKEVYIKPFRDWRAIVRNRRNRRRMAAAAKAV